MPTLTVKVSDQAMHQLRQEASIQGLSLSAWVRHKLDLNAQDDRYEDLERRISRLEEMAGL